MYWKFNLMTSHIETLLDKEDVTLHELMDEDDILQECKSQNKKLINFLLRPEAMKELVKLITEDPEEDVDEKVKYKYPNTACELLTSDISDITDKLTEDSSLLAAIYAFLESDGPLNPLLASFFSKIMGLLINRKSEFMLNFLRSKADFVGSLLKHLGTSAIMDLLLRLITCIESNEIRTKVEVWLNEQHLIERLVSMIDPSEADEKPVCNASQSLCDIIRLSREQLQQLQDHAESDPLLDTIELPETISSLLSHMLDGDKSESVLTSGLAVIQTLLEYKRCVYAGDDLCRPEGSSEQMTALDAERLARGVSNTLTAVTPRLKDLHNILLDPPKQHYSAMQTTAGMLDPPLGNSRLQIARLISSLLLTNTHAINEELVKLGTMNALLDLFFQYVWNNFLHTQLEICINTVFSNTQLDTEENSENILLSQLFTECKLVQRIIDRFQENQDILCCTPVGCRRGYMGHLTKIANDVVVNTEKGNNTELIKSYLKELPDDYGEKWDNFVLQSLAATNKANTLELAGSHPVQSGSEDDDSEFRDIPFPQDTAMQQAFSDYQLQQMTSNFIDQFGFNEDEFVDQEESIDDPFKNRISSLDFNAISTEDNAPLSSFEQVCNERIDHFNDKDSNEDLWEEKQITFSSTSDNKQSNRSIVSTTSANVGSDDNSSSDSDEDLDSPTVIKQASSISGPEKMDTDSNDVWPGDGNISIPVAMDTIPDWDNKSLQPKQDSWANFTDATAPTNDQSWADFNNFTPLAADLTRTDPGPRSSSPMLMDTGETSRALPYLIQSAPANLTLISTSTESPRETQGKNEAVSEDKVPEICEPNSEVRSLEDESNLREVIAKTQPRNKEQIAAEQSEADSTSDLELLKLTESVSKTEKSASDEKIASSSSEEVTSSSSSNDILSSSSSEVISSTSEEVMSSESTSSCDLKSGDLIPENNVIKTTETETMASQSMHVDLASINNTRTVDYLDEDDNDDLGDNFSFLSKAGLMKTESNNVDDVSDVTNSIDNIEQARVKAQQALEDYTNVTQKQNGPV